MDVNDVCLRLEVIVPDALQQHRPRHDLAGMAHQIFKQSELARLQIDLLPGAAHISRSQVHLQIADHERCRLALTLITPRQTLDAGQQFGEDERLCQVVAATRFEAAHTLVNRGEGRYEQDRRDVVLLTQGLQQTEPIDFARQHAVQHDRVEVLARSEKQTVGTIVRVLDDVAGFPKPLHDKAGDGLVVFYDQYAHCLFSPVHSSVTDGRRGRYSRVRSKWLRGRIPLTSAALYGHQAHRGQ